jgi:alginate O-acetyltransferase complex protein AlgI
MSGLWHGASWNFVLWGAFHGVFLILERIILLNLFKKMGKFGTVISLFYCFFVVMMGWVLFFIEDLESVGIFYSKLFAFDFSPLSSPYTNEFFFILCVAIFFAFCTLSKPFQKMHDLIYFGEYKSWQIVMMFVITLCLFTFSIASIAASSFNPFIYYRF